MKNTKITYYSQEEKNIYINHFILKTQGSRKAFEEYIFNFYTKLNLVAPGNNKFIQGKSYKGVLVSYDFNTHHKLWDKEGNNLISYFLTHPQFEISSKALHRLNYVHPDWHHKNKQGENALTLLAKKGEINLLKKIIKDFQVNPDSKDKDDNYFTKHLLSPHIIPDIELGFHLFIRTLTRFQSIEKLLNEYPHHLDISGKRLNDISENWAKTWHKVKELYELNKDPKMNEIALNMVEVQWKKIDTKIMAIKLTKELEYNLPQKTEVKKAKI